MDSSRDPIDPNAAALASPETIEAIGETAAPFIKRAAEKMAAGEAKVFYDVDLDKYPKFKSAVKQDDRTFEEVLDQAAKMVKEDDAPKNPYHDVLEFVDQLSAKPNTRIQVKVLVHTEQKTRRPSVGERLQVDDELAGMPPAFMKQFRKEDLTEEKPEAEPKWFDGRTGLESPPFPLGEVTDGSDDFAEGSEGPVEGPGVDS